MRRVRPALGLALLAGSLLIAACGKPTGAASEPALTPPVTASAAVSAPAPDALAGWWDAHHVAFPSAPLITHADVMAAGARAVAADTERLSRETIGRSIEGRELTHLAIGRGPMRVLLWSQMHGDEPSATPAIFDVLEWLRRERGGDPRVRRIEERLTVHVVPMLNPDGAQRFTRRNAQGIDVNRDALHLQTPEGRALKALRDRLEPVLGFNLHNQNGQTSAGSPPRPATISLLAVAHDAARSDSPRRQVAKQTAAIIRDALEPLIPGQVGRYSDEFEPRAFGDNLGRWGTAVVLVESGPLQGADAEARLVRLNFVALVTALDALASGRANGHSTAAYDSLPVNESNLLRLRVRNATIVTGADIPPFTGDIGINTSRAIAVRDGVRAIVVTPRIADLGDLRVFGTLEDVDATGLTATPAFDAQAREGALLRMPDWRTWKGATLSVGQPGILFLLAPPADVPADGSSGSWRLVRRIEPGAPVP